MKIKGNQLKFVKRRAARIVAAKDREYNKLQKRLENVYKLWINKEFDQINKITINSFAWKQLEKVITDTVLSDSRIFVRNTINFLNSYEGYGLTPLQVEVLTTRVLGRTQETLKKDAARNVNTMKKNIGKVINAAGEITEEELAQLLRDKMIKQSVTRSKALAFPAAGSLNSISYDATAKKARRDMKIWIYTFLARTPRPGHLALDGEAIKLNEKFDVNGYQARYPHDAQNLPISERANCHCVVYYA